MIKTHKLFSHMFLLSLVSVSVFGTTIQNFESGTETKDNRNMCEKSLCVLITATTSFVDFLFSFRRSSTTTVYTYFDNPTYWEY